MKWWWFGEELTQKKGQRLRIQFEEKGNGINKKKDVNRFKALKTELNKKLS